jgi:hypothetical protein
MATNRRNASLYRLEQSFFYRTQHPDQFAEKALDCDCGLRIVHSSRQYNENSHLSSVILSTPNAYYFTAPTCAADSSFRKDFIMSLQTLGRKFVEMCNQGKNFDVMRTMYAPDIVSVEGDGKETVGQNLVIKKSEDWVSDKTFNGETCAGPFFNGANPDQFVVYFTLDITPKATGKRITLQEVGVYTVKGDKITREQFFYDGEH